MPDNLTDSELLKRSVTANEVTTVRDGAVLRVMVPYQMGYDRYTLPPQPPPYWSIQRDILLRSTIHHEAMWAAAIGICISKMASMAWEIQGKVGLRVRAMQDILLDADGKRVGWVGFLSKQLRDYLTTDNGSAFEIIRASRARGSKIVGIRHLDSIRVLRTGDPEIPAIYRDRWGKYHELKDYQVVLFADMPDPGETYYGVGLSASSRAYPAIYKLAVIENYLREKVAGLRPLAIYIVNGVLDSQLKGAIDAAKQEEVARGLVGYMGAVIVGIPDEMQPQVATIPLAELPDRFSRKEEFDISILTYADVLGLDIQDLQPLGGQALGTGAQSVVLHEKARGKGMNAWKQDFTHALNEFIMPEETVFTFTEKDYRDISQRATVENTIATAATARIGAKITTPAQELQLMVDQDILPKEFLPRDITPGDNLSDTEKPTSASPTAFDPEQPLAEQAQGRLDEEGNIKPGAKTDAQLQNEEVARMIASGQGDQVGYGGGDKRSPDEIHAAKVEDEKQDQKTKTKELLESIHQPAVDYAQTVIARQLEMFEYKHLQGKHDQKTHGQRGSGKTQINQFIKEIGSLTYEKAGVFDDNGNLIFTKTGEKYQVGFTPSDVRKITGCKLMIHNHPGAVDPKDGIERSFSPEDLIFASTIQAKEFVAIAGKSMFSIKPKPGNNFPREEPMLVKSILEMNQQVYLDNCDQIKRGEIDINRAEWEHGRELTQAYAKAFDLIYTETRME